MTVLLSERQARAAMLLWDGGFDTADIGELLGCGEAAVERVLRAAREVTREFYRDMKVAGLPAPDAPHGGEAA